MACDRDEWAAQAPRHVLDEARLAASGWALQHDGEPLRLAGFEDGDLVTRGQVEGRFCRRMAEPIRACAKSRGMRHRRARSFAAFRAG